MDKVFILEDDASICGLIRVALQMNDIALSSFACCEDFLAAIEKEQPDVALLDVMLPDGNGFDVLKKVKAEYPFALRRKRRENVVKAGELTLDYDTMTISFRGKKLDLNRKEYELGRFFIENAGKVLKRETLLTEIWGYESGETRTLDNHVARLRKLGISIDTVFGVGYKLNV